MNGMESREIKPMQFWYFFSPSRSYSKPRSKPSQRVRSENLKCAICVHYSQSGEREKSELVRSYEQKIYRKPLVTLSMKSTQ